MMATYMALLAANQAILSLSGSKQKINAPFAGLVGGKNDPTQSDWLNFKAGDKKIDASGGMVSTLHFMSQLIKTATENQEELKGKGRDSKVFEILGNYARGKTSPFMSTMLDFATHHTYNKDVLPPFSDKPREGKRKLSWEDYLIEQQTPIPVAEGIADVIDAMKAKGMTEPQIKQILDGIFVGVITGGTGAKIKDEIKTEKPVFNPNKFKKEKLQSAKFKP
jgi:hypothetical protein